MMKKFLIRALKVAGYLAFFAVCFLFAFRWTLPLDKMQDFLVRKAQDEYRLDLEIDKFEVAGLAGLTMQGITVTPKPTMEEQAAIREARAALKAWNEQKKLEAEEAKNSADTQAADKKEKSKGNKADSPADDQEELAFDEVLDAGLGGAPEKNAAAKAAQAASAVKQAAAKDKKAEKDEAPKVPEGPAPMTVQSIDVSLSPFALLTGSVKGSADASLFGGHLAADFALNKKAVPVQLQAKNLELAQATLLKRVMPAPIVGVVDVDADLTIPLNEKRAPQIQNTKGNLDLKLQNLMLGPGVVPLSAGSNAAGLTEFELPATSISELGGTLKFDDHRATFEQFSATGKDVEAELTGYLQLASTFKNWGPRAHVRFKFSDDYLTRNSLRSLLASLPLVKRGTDSEGFTGISLTGTFDKIAYKAQKETPYKQEASAAKKDSKDPKAKKDTKATAPKVAPGRVATPKPATPVRPAVAPKPAAIAPVPPVPAAPVVEPPIPQRPEVSGEAAMEALVAAVAEEPQEEVVQEEVVIEEPVVENADENNGDNNGDGEGDGDGDGDDDDGDDDNDGDNDGE